MTEDNFNMCSNFQLVVYHLHWTRMKCPAQYTEQDNIKVRNQNNILACPKQRTPSTAKEL